LATLERAVARKIFSDREDSPEAQRTFPATTALSAHRLRERSLRTKISRVEPPEPRENIESSTSNIERRNKQRFALPFDVRRSMFGVRCSAFDVRRSMFDVRRSMFDVRRSMFDVRCSMFLRVHSRSNRRITSALPA